MLMSALNFDTAESQATQQCVFSGVKWMLEHDPGLFNTVCEHTDYKSPLCASYESDGTEVFD